jgi:hypothetical protein
MNNLAFLLLGEHVLWSRSDGHGGTITYKYYDAITWAVAVVALLWIICFLTLRYLRQRKLMRPARNKNARPLRKIIKLKRELTSRYLRPGFSLNIHAVGIGLIEGGSEPCIQVFVNNANDELWPGTGRDALPPNYRGVPLRLIEMPVAALLSSAPAQSRPESLHGIRNQQEVIVGGISGANSNLAGQSGTIGYFCRRRRRLRKSNDVLLLSNSHVFADLRRAKIDQTDLIMQPSPGEAGSNRPIGALVNFSPMIMTGDIDQPNHIDAALAQLWPQQTHGPVIPLIGEVKGFAQKEKVEVGERVRKFGRTSGYTEGKIFSIYLDIRIRYDRTGQIAFFRDQLLIEPETADFPRFVGKGDSGSLLVDETQYAIGLIFAGAAEDVKSEDARNDSASGSTTDKPNRIEAYGVANPISEVLDRMKVDLLISG